MIISARIYYNIPDHIMELYFDPSYSPSCEEILNTIFEDYPDWEDEFADYWSDWRKE